MRTGYFLFTCAWYVYFFSFFYSSKTADTTVTFCSSLGSAWLIIFKIFCHIVSCIILMYIMYWYICLHHSVYLWHLFTLLDLLLQHLFIASSYSLRCSLVNEMIYKHSGHGLLYLYCWSFFIFHQRLQYYFHLVFANPICLY